MPNNLPLLRACGSPLSGSGDGSVVVTGSVVLQLVIHELPWTQADARAAWAAAHASASAAA